MDTECDARTQRKANQIMRISFKEKQRAKILEINRILRKSECEKTDAERKVLEESTHLVQILQNRKLKKLQLKERCEEIEEPSHVLEAKCNILADAIKSSKCVVLYTGAGISTAAHIPDYRGPNGIWTQINKNGSITEQCDLSLAEPTYSHMAIAQLCRLGVVKHVVSQNCDGLHIRSGIPQQNISEIHGNMYIEVCKTCKTQYLRTFDVTEKTSLHRHKTGRNCHCCNNGNGELIDTIIHFGEKGKLLWPLNWNGAAKAVASADMILCVGSSLKVLRKYHCLWPKKQNGKPQIYIVNLQWTPKDSQSQLKIYGKCDVIFQYVMKYLNIEVPPYQKNFDPIYHFSTPLKDEETETCHRRKLFETSDSSEMISYYPSWFGKGIGKGVKKRK